MQLKTEKLCVRHGDSTGINVQKDVRCNLIAEGSVGLYLS